MRLAIEIAALAIVFAGVEIALIGFATGWRLSQLIGKVFDS